MARSRKSRKAAFLAVHPLCIFCGGTTASAEPDHVPSRQMFHAKQWPEGYEFPACASCNRATKDVEQIVATFARIYPDPSTEAEAAEMRAALRAVANNYPRVLIQSRPRAIDVRRFLRAHGIRKDPNVATSEMPLLSAEGPLVRLAVGNFARKLFTALHYKHTGKIVPAAGGVFWKFFSNADSLSGAIPPGIFELAQGVPALKRGKADIESQFSYRFRCSDDGAMGVYFAVFRFSFAFLGYVRMNAAAFPAELDGRIVRPLQPNLDRPIQ